MYHHEQLRLLHEIQKVEFAATELTLYLDTHPCDKKALADYNTLACQLKSLIDMYEKRFGPMKVFGFGTSRYPWEWIYTPWPWEIEY
jgi:spore coat protein JB